VNPAPYPADTRAKGWRFELDYERITQSDTWDLAAEVPMAQPALLMMWMMAWQQTPCGSLSNDEAVIRAKCRIPADLWPSMRELLMRGWWAADDGRLYHNAITERVLEMIEARGKNAKRVASHKQKLREQRAGNALPTPSGNALPTASGNALAADAVTTPEPEPEPIGDTEHPHQRAGGALEPGEVDASAIVGAAQPTAAGVICKALRRAGVADVNPGHPRLLALIEAGATEAEFTGFAPSAISKGSGFAWVLGAVEGERKRAANTAQTVHRGQMPAAAKPAWVAERDQREAAAAAFAGPYAARKPAPWPTTTNTVEVINGDVKLLG
jgi:hypothetical protein